MLPHAGCRSKADGRRRVEGGAYPLKRAARAEVHAVAEHRVTLKGRSS